MTSEKTEWEHKSLSQRIDYVNNNLDFVIMGLPGGGTTYVANLLTACKTPTGHEEVFHQSGKLMCPNNKGDCSGFVYPWRELITKPTIYTIIRDPLDTINSLIQHHKKTLQEACQLVTQVYQHRPNTFRLKNIASLVQRITNWPRPSIFRQIDFMDRKKRNYRGTPRRITNDDLPEAVKDLRAFWDYD